MSAFMGAARQKRLTELLRRGLAAGSAALVFALGVFAASPALHKQLHQACPVTDDQCAVVLFSNGVSVPVAVVAPLPAIADWQEHAPTPASEIFLDSPRYLLQPERGPPVA